MFLVLMYSDTKNKENTPTTIYYMDVKRQTFWRSGCQATLFAAKLRHILKYKIVYEKYQWFSKWSFVEKGDTLDVHPLTRGYIRGTCMLKNKRIKSIHIPRIYIYILCN